MTTHLRPDRHPQGDFFIADILDAAPKNDQASMEHPVFALKAGDHTVREYERHNFRIQVQPGAFGCATIHDKDIWIYAISQLVAAADYGRYIERTVQFTAYDFLVSTNRDTSGRAYERMAAALDRLAGTRLATNIETNDRRERRGFGLIDSYRVIERDADDRMVAIEITLPDWLYRAVEAREVLTLSRDYFRLRKPLDRRIYELVRKHCGQQKRWRVSLRTLQAKSGSRASLREFRRSIRALADTNPLPDYRIAFDVAADTVTAYPRSDRGRHAQINDLLGTPIYSDG